MTELATTVLGLIHEAAGVMCSWMNWPTEYTLPALPDFQTADSTVSRQGEMYAYKILQMVRTARGNDEIVVAIGLSEVRDQYANFLTDSEFRHAAKKYAFRWGLQFGRINDPDYPESGIHVPDRILTVMLVPEGGAAEPRHLFIQGHRVPIRLGCESLSTIPEASLTSALRSMIRFEGMFDFLDLKTGAQILDFIPTDCVYPEYYEDFDSNAPDIEGSDSLYDEICNHYPRLQREHVVHFSGWPVRSIRLMEFSSGLDTDLEVRGLIAKVRFEQTDGEDVYLALRHPNYCTSAFMVAEEFGEWVHKNLCNYVFSAYQIALSEELKQEIDLDPLMRTVNDLDDEDETFFIV